MAKIKLLVLVLAGLGQLSAAVPGMDIVRDGQPAATIVIPNEPLQGVQSAAEELQYHVRLVSGAVLPVVPVSGHPKGNLILLGAELAGRAGVTYGKEANAWVIRLVDNDRLLLAGDDSPGPALTTQTINNYVRKGTLFAVYDFLEKHLGVRWLWPGELGTFTPPAKTITVQSYNVQGKPAFLFSRLRDSLVFDNIGKPTSWASVEAANHLFKEQAQWLIRHRFCLGFDLQSHHAFTGWWERYGKTHPEYFNLLPDGTRRSDPTYCGGGAAYVSLCVSNPGVPKAIIADWLATRTALSPGLDASENDSCSKCTCPNCLAWDVPDPDLGFPWDERAARCRSGFAQKDPKWWSNLGRVSDRECRFWMALLKEARKVDPSVMLTGLAYANYIKPPLKAKLDPHILIYVTSAIGYPGWTDPKKVQANRAEWLGWARTGARLMLRPNYLLEGGTLPLFLARRLGEEFKFCADHNMLGTDFDSLTGEYAAQGPNLYMLARLNDRPDLTVDAVLNEYYAAFGPAKDAVRAYWSYWEKVADHPPAKPIPGGWAAYLAYGYIHFTPAVMAPGRRLIEAAARAAKGDRLAEQRVAFLDEGLRHAELVLDLQRAYAEYQSGKGEKKKAQTALGRLIEFRKATEHDLVGNYGFLYEWERRYWNIAFLLKGMPENPNTIHTPAPTDTDCGQEFVIRLKRTARIDKLKIYNGAGPDGCKGLKVLFSVDNKHYTEVLRNQLSRVTTAGVGQEFQIPPTETRYIKLQVLSGYQDNLWRLAEFEALENRKNMAAKQNGGALIRWSSDYGPQYAAALIIDGNTKGQAWLSSPMPLPCR